MPDPGRTSGARRRHALAGAGCLVAVGALGAVLHQTSGEVGFDRFAARVVGPQSSPVSPPVAIALSRLVDREPAFVLFLLLAAAAAALQRRARPVLAVVATGAVTQGLVLLAKRLVDRTLFSEGPTYPSGHMAGAVALGVLAVLVVRRRGLFAAAAVAVVAGGLVVATALGAIWTQSHVWTDVVGGGLLGAGTALVLWSAVVPCSPCEVQGRDVSLLPRVARGA